MNIDNKYKEFIYTFEKERDFFKCHEILEDIWVAETACETRKHPAINLLLISVGALHWKKGNLKGALSVFENSLTHYKDLSDKIELLGINSTELMKIVENNIIEIKLNKNYKEFFLPLYKKDA